MDGMLEDVLHVILGMGTLDAILVQDLNVWNVQLVIPIVVQPVIQAII